MTALIFWVLYSSLASVAFFLLLKSNSTNKKKLNQAISKLRIDLFQMEGDKNKQIESIQKLVVKESRQKEVYYKRVIELENGVKTGTGITLRQEITKFEGNFDDKELFQMRHGLHFCIKDRATSIVDVKYYVTLIDKITELTSKIEKSKAGFDNG